MIKETKNKIWTKKMVKLKNLVESSDQAKILQINIVHLLVNMSFNKKDKLIKLIKKIN